MKKITFALIALLFVSGAFAQQFRGSRAPQIQQEKNTVKSINNHSKKGIGHATSTKAVIWTNNFNTPAEWTMNHTAGTTGDWVISADMGSSWATNLASTSGGNYAWFDSDAQGSGTTNEAFMTYTGTINCTGHTNIQLVFNQYYTRYMTTYDETVVQVSADGTTWVDYSVNSTLAYNGETSNPSAVYVNITATAANQGAVHVRFKYKGAWGYSWQIDDLSVEDVVNNDISAQKSFVNMNGWDYFTVVPVKQLDTVYCAGAVKNLGLNAQTNVVLNLNVNGGAYTGASPVLASLASGVTDTLWTGFIPTETVPTAYEMAYSYTQTQTDENLTNNIGDTTNMYSDASEFWRSFNATSVMSSYSFGASAPATSGMEYGATYHFKAADQIDSIIVPLYKVKGTPSIQGKLYTVNTSTNAHTLVASTAVVSPAVLNFTGSASWATLGFTTPYTVAADEYLSATIAITGTMTTDTLFIGSDGAFAGDASIAGDAYLNDGTAWDWYTYNGVPTVGIKTHPQSSETDILTFNLTTPVATGIVNATAHTVALTVPFGTPVTALVPTITVSAGATISPATAVAQDFTAPVTYTVTAEDGTTTQDWVVTVTVAANTATDIVTFDFTTPATTGIVNATTHTVALTVPFGTVVTALVPTIAVSAGATISPATAVAQDFTAPVTYTVTAEDGTTTQPWTVTVTVASATDNDILTFNFNGLTPAVIGTVDATAHTVALTVPFGTAVTALVPTITVSTGATVSPATAVAQDFTNAVTYNVTAIDGTTVQPWTVTVTVTAASAAKDITLFDFNALTPAVVGTIDATAHTVALTVPFGTAVTALVPTITVSDFATVSPATAVATDFTAPVVYTVTAQDGTTQTWTVTVTVTAGSSAKDITLFDFNALTPAVVGTVNATAHTVALTVPAGTAVTALVPTIAISAGATISPATAVAQDFTAPVTYTVTAEDGTTQAWIVTVTVAAVQTYTVTFSVVGANGTLAATVDAAAITSPATVEAGKNVIFTAAPATNFQVKEWKLNNVVVAGNVTNTYTLSTLAANSTVTVEFELIDGISEVTENVASIYPNPANDVVNVKMNNTINKIAVVNMNGQVVAESVINNNEGSINVSNIANGMYFLRIETANGITMNKIQIVK